jgi:hypothetical protein
MYFNTQGALACLAKKLLATNNFCEKYPKVKAKVYFYFYGVAIGIFETNTQARTYSVVFPSNSASCASASSLVARTMPSL